MQNTFCVGIRNNTAKVARGIVADSSTENDSLCILLLEEFEHLAQRKGAADIGVQDEEPIWLAFEDGIAEMIETTCSAKSLIFAEVLNFLELGKFFGRVSDEVTEDGFVIVAHQDDFLDSWDFSNGAKAVPDDGVASDVKERLR